MQPARLAFWNEMIQILEPRLTSPLDFSAVQRSEMPKAFDMVVEHLPPHDEAVVPVVYSCLRLFGDASLWAANGARPPRSSMLAASLLDALRHVTSLPPGPTLVALAAEPIFGVTNHNLGTDTITPHPHQPHQPYQQQQQVPPPPSLLQPQQQQQRQPNTVPIFPPETQTETGKSRCVFTCSTETSYKRLTAIQNTIPEFDKALQHPHFMLRDQAERIFKKVALTPLGRMVVNENKPREDSALSFQTPLQYDLLPSSVEVIVPIYNHKLLEHLNAGRLERGVDDPTIVMEKPLIQPATTFVSPKEDEDLILDRIENYVVWCVHGKVQLIRAPRMEVVFKKLRENMIGVEALVDVMKKDFEPFTDKNGDIPQGVLLYGPPGTGKTKTIEYLMKMGIFPVCRALSASDFSKPLVGDDVRMIDHMAERAAALPWQAVGVSIDEIDGLAPDRSAEGGGAKNKTDLLNKLLSIVAGNQGQKNLVLFGSTNNFDKMDEAFRRRLDYKLFVGKPSFQARQSWFEWKTLAYGLYHFLLSATINGRKVLDPQIIRQILLEAEMALIERQGHRNVAAVNVTDQKPIVTNKDELENIAFSKAKLLIDRYQVQFDNEFITFAVKCTINFSNDAMLKLLRKMYFRYTNTKDRQDRQEPYEFPVPTGTWQSNSMGLTEFLLELTKRICVSERIFLGNRIIPDVLLDKVTYVDGDEEWQTQLAEMCKNYGQVRGRALPFGQVNELATHLLLVDFNTISEKQFQLQILKSATAGSSRQEIRDYTLAYKKAKETFCVKVLADAYIKMIDQSLLFLGHSIYNVGDAVGLVHQIYTTRPELEKQVLPQPFSNTLFACKPRDQPTTLKDILVYARDIVTVLDVFRSGPGTYHALLSGATDYSAEFHQMAVLTSLVADQVRNNIVAVSQCDYESKLHNMLTRIAKDLQNCMQKLLEALDLGTLQDTYHIPCFGHATHSKNTDEALLVLIELAHQLKVDSLEVLDFDTFVRLHRSSQEDQRSYVHKIFSESSEYLYGSLVVIDLDSIGGVTTDFQSLTEATASEAFGVCRRNFTWNLEAASIGQQQRPIEAQTDVTFTYHVQRPDLLSFVLDKIKKLPSPRLPLWICVLASDPYLVARFKQQFHENEWPLTFAESTELQRRQDNNREFECKFCRLPFTKKENEVGKCQGKHHGLLGWRKERDGEQGRTETFASVDLLKTFCQENPSALPLGKWQWQCCQAGINGHGCVKAEHEA